MKKLISRILLLLFIISLIACINIPGAVSPDPQFVQGITRGEISSYDNISVVFTDDLGKDKDLLVNSPFNFSPDIKGETHWLDDYTLVFTPDSPLPENTSYSLTIDPKLLARPEVPLFTVEMKTIIQEYDINPGDLHILNSDDSGNFTYITNLQTSDSITKEDLSEKILVKHDGQEIPFRLEGKQIDTDFKIIVDGVYKQKQGTKLLVSTRKTPLKTRKKIIVDIPSINEFIFMPGIPEIQSDGSIELFFSDPIDVSQNLNGLVRIDGVSDLQIKKNGNSLKLFSRKGWPETFMVKVSNTLQNTERVKLNDEYIQSFRIPSVKPEVHFIGKGTILPTTQGTTIPIETVNLSAIMVEAVKIHGQNMTQFLQINDLDGEKDIHRVGEVVWQKVVDLNWSDDNVDRWVKYGLDISPLLEEDPDGIFQIRLTFRHPHIQYPCTLPDDDDSVQFQSLMPELEAENSSWDNWDQNYNYDYRRERNNPCHPAYYQKWSDHNISVSRNVIVSNIGVIARKSSDNKLHVALSDIRNTNPLSGSTIEIYNYQNRVVKRTISNRSGQAVIDLDSEKPYYLKVENNGQFNYLKLDDGNAISVSHFDIGGVAPQEGVQGFIYGERDIWRPGDLIHLSLILSDPSDSLPEDHPVTVELYDPFGKKVIRQLLSDNNGFFYAPLQTQPDYPTGTYNVKFHIGGILFEKEIRIETVVPNRLKIDLGFNNNAEYFTNGNITGTLTAKWLHGAIAGNLNADIKMNLRPIPTVFSGYEDYIFDDYTRQFSSKTETLYGGQLNNRGNSDFSKYVSVQNSPGMLQATLTTRVFESGGNFSTEYFSKNYHPYESYVGIQLPKGDVARGMLLTDIDHTVDIALVDKDGKSIQNGSVTAEFYKVEWRWWWETDKENLTGFTSRRSSRKISSGTVNIVNGKGQWTFRTNYPDWGRYYIRVKDNQTGHSSGKIVYIDWPGWAGRAQDEGSQGVSMLVLNSDKYKYNVGENITVNIPGNSEGRCLVSIENGGKILKSEWVQFTGENTAYKFKATPEMAPNIYIHATFVQSHLQTLNDRPIRSYGVIPVSIENPASHLQPVISTSDVFKPGSAVRINISEQSGKSMTYTLAIVDEGLLGLTKFQTPNPWNYFFRKRASLLQTFDLYDDIAGAFSGDLNTLLAIGGGDEGEGSGGKKANRFESVVLFEEPRTLGAGKTQSHIIKIPEYVGAVRVMVVAASETSYGREEKLVPVKKELMVLGSLPRVLGVNEEINFPVSIFALDEKISNLNLKVETKGPISVLGQSEQSFRVSSMGEIEKQFKLKTTAESGIAEISVYAEDGSFNAKYEIEIDVRSPAPEITTVTDIVINSGQSKRTNITLPGVIGTNTMTMELYQMPPLNIAHRLSFLIRYPHGCIEQTTSGVFPQLYLNNITELTDEEVDKTEHNISSGIERLLLFQTTLGGFSYWPGESVINEWGTNYAGHFIVEAKKKGYHIPDSLYDRWVTYQKNAANTWISSSAEGITTQAYRLYTLALAGEADLAAMNRLRSMNLSNHNNARWRLALAYSLSGHRSIAREMVKSQSVSVQSYTELSGTFGNDIRDKAMILEALVDLDEESGIRSLAQDISDALTSEKSLSTQTTAYSLIAMSKFGVYQENRDDISVLYRWGNIEEVVASNRPVIYKNIDLKGQNNGFLEIENLSNDIIYPRIITRGTPAPGQEVEKDQGLFMTVTYKDLEGNNVSLDSISSGMDIEVIVNVENRGNKNYEELVLSHLVPSGWEIHNSRLNGTSNEQYYDYKDIRDDRVYTYFDLDRNKSKTFSTMVNVSYKGKYYLPLISCEAMYDPEIVSVERGRWLNVK